MTSVATMYQHLKADSDSNGNPQRLYVIMDQNGNIIKVIDEEYSGFPNDCKGLIQLPEINISAKEYKTFKKSFDV